MSDDVAVVVLTYALHNHGHRQRQMSQNAGSLDSNRIRGRRNSGDLLAGHGRIRNVYLIFGVAAVDDDSKKMTNGTVLRLVEQRWTTIFQLDIVVLHQRHHRSRHTPTILLPNRGRCWRGNRHV